MIVPDVTKPSNTSLAGFLVVDELEVESDFSASKAVSNALHNTNIIPDNFGGYKATAGDVIDNSGRKWQLQIVAVCAKSDFIKSNLNKKYKTVWHLLEKEVDEKYYLSEKLTKTILAHGSGKYWSKSEINRLFARPLTASMHKMHRANQDNYYSDDFIYGDFRDENVIMAQNLKNGKI